jgi:NAD dependent epimerase/dehydratase family enzyme
MEGVVNVVSPAPIQNADFMKTLRNELKMVFGLNTPRLLLVLGSKIIGTEPELVLKSRNVVPARLVNNGFTFRYPALSQALKTL